MVSKKDGVIYLILASIVLLFYLFPINRFSQLFLFIFHYVLFFFIFLLTSLSFFWYKENNFISRIKECLSKKDILPIFLILVASVLSLIFLDSTLTTKTEGFVNNLFMYTPYLVFFLIAILGIISFFWHSSKDFATRLLNTSFYTLVHFI